MTLEIWQVRLVTASLCEGWMICLRFDSLPRIVKALLVLCSRFLKRSECKDIHSEFIVKPCQTTLYRCTLPVITVEAFFGCDSEASSLPGPCNRDLKCDDSVDSVDSTAQQSLDVFGCLWWCKSKERLFQHVSTAQTCCCSMGEDCI